jgi:hypothetical protein
LSKDDPLFPCSEKAISQLANYTSPTKPSDSHQLDQLVSAFPDLFSEQLGTVKGMACHLDLTDGIPVRSRPYQCSPPRLQALREIVQGLLEQGVIRKS